VKAPAIIVFVALACAPCAVLGDSPAAPRPWIAISERGDFFFKMVPPQWKEELQGSVMVRGPFGVAYTISEDGEFEEVWRTEGWHAFEGFLSEDGRHFVRFGP